MPKKLLVNYITVWEGGNHLTKIVLHGKQERRVTLGRRLKNEKEFK